MSIQLAFQAVGNGPPVVILHEPQALLQVLRGWLREARGSRVAVAALSAPSALATN